MVAKVLVQGEPMKRDEIVRKQREFIFPCVSTYYSEPTADGARRDAARLGC